MFFPATLVAAVLRRACIIALLSAAVLVLLAQGAWARSFDTVDATRFTLAERDFDAGSLDTSALEQLYPRVGLQAVLSDLDQTTSPAGRRTPALARVRDLSVAYGFSPSDAATRTWTPQGISGSADADPKGLIAGRRVHAVSWHEKGDEAARISFVDVDAKRYRNVLLVKPKGGGTRFDNVPVHAGGTAWLGKYLYVADTRHGFRVFDTERIVRVPPAVSPNYPYLLPQVGRVENDGARLTFSSVSFDRAGLSSGPLGPTEPALVVGEYRRRGGRPARVVRFPVNVQTGRLASPVTKASNAYVAKGLFNLQGSTTVQGSVIGSSSSGPRGRLYTGRPGSEVADRPWGAFPEDLYSETSTGSLLSVTEGTRYGRTVFGVPVAALRLSLDPPIG
jgi:hypothetical protein